MGILDPGFQKNYNPPPIAACKKQDLTKIVGAALGTTRVNLIDSKKASSKNNYYFMIYELLSSLIFCPVTDRRKAMHKSPQVGSKIKQKCFFPTGPKIETPIGPPT